MRHTSFMLACSVLLCTLAGCGGGSSGTASTPSSTSGSTPSPTVIAANDQLTITARMPVQVQHARLTIQVVGEDQPLYDNFDFSDFEAVVSNIALSKYQGRIVWVTLRPSTMGNSKIYDVVKDQWVSFDQGQLHAVGEINSISSYLQLSPLSEAIYQRALVRSGYVDFSQAPSLLPLTAKQIHKATQEVTNALNGAFNVTQLPKMNTPISNWQSTGVATDYFNFFSGLGWLSYFQQLYPQTTNSYIALANSLGTDLRDGSLDGRSLLTDTTVFQPIVIPAAPLNTNPAFNTTTRLGALQQTTREQVGYSIKQATLDYAYRHNQNILNPQGYLTLQTNAYYSSNLTDNSFNLRWNGAGDYRRAFGFNESNLCQSSGYTSNYPCQQGLNADDIEGLYSDVEYLIGHHQLGSCTIDWMPSGDVKITQNGTVYTGQLNRESSDNLLRLDSASQRYLLNVGTGTTTPVTFMQFLIENQRIVQAQIGQSSSLYPQQLDRTQLSCN